MISLDLLWAGNISECRNKALQTMFTQIGIAEKAGSGADKILQGWKSQQWRQPNVQEITQPDRVQWTLPMVSLIPQESLDRLKIADEMEMLARIASPARESKQLSKTPMLANFTCRHLRL